MGSITPMNGINFNTKTTPVKWNNYVPQTDKGYKGITIAELINKLVTLASKQEIDLNAEVQIFDPEGNIVGVENIQRGPGKVVILR